MIYDFPGVPLNVLGPFLRSAGQLSAPKTKILRKSKIFCWCFVQALEKHQKERKSMINDFTGVAQTFWAYFMRSAGPQVPQKSMFSNYKKINHQSIVQAPEKHQKERKQTTGTDRYCHVLLGQLNLRKVKQ